MVMISMMISTSITSMSGVVLMSIITSGSPPLLLPTLIAMVRPSALRRWFGHEADLLDRCALALEHHPPDRLVARLAVAADVDFGLRRHRRDLAEALEQRVAVGDELLVPECLLYTSDAADER